MQRQRCGDGSEGLCVTTSCWPPCDFSSSFSCFQPATDRFNPIRNDISVARPKPKAARADCVARRAVVHDMRTQTKTRTHNDEQFLRATCNRVGLSDTLQKCCLPASNTHNRYDVSSLAARFKESAVDSSIYKHDVRFRGLPHTSDQIKSMGPAHQVCGTYAEQPRQ
jgi:hypothetical protein